MLRRKRLASQQQEQDASLAGFFHASEEKTGISLEILAQAALQHATETTSLENLLPQQVASQDLRDLIVQQQGEIEHLRQSIAAYKVNAARQAFLLESFQSQTKVLSTAKAKLQQEVESLNCVCTTREDQVSYLFQENEALRQKVQALSNENEALKQQQLLAAFQKNQEITGLNEWYGKEIALALEKATGEIARLKADAEAQQAIATQEALAARAECERIRTQYQTPGASAVQALPWTQNVSSNEQLLQALLAHNAVALQQLYLPLRGLPQSSIFQRPDAALSQSVVAQPLAPSQAQEPELSPQSQQPPRYY
jgi:hypothetical protein